MDSLCVIFAPALITYTKTLLSRIAVDYNLPCEELVAKYMTLPDSVKTSTKPRKPRAPKDPNAPPKIPTSERPMCPSLTGKKTPCKNRCLPGSDKCHLHAVTLPGGEPKPPKPPRVLKEKKVKSQPSHNHAPLVAPDAPCQLCDTHGDATNPSLTNVQFESSQSGMSLQERLRMIIQMGEDAPDAPTSSPVESPGSIIHRMKLAEKGKVPEYDDDDVLISDEDDGMTEDEFDEEELLE